MRRSIVLILALILGTAAITSAQENTSSAFDAEKHQTETPDGIPVESAPGHMITGIWEPVQLEKLDQAPDLREPEDLPATDFCVGSPNLTLRPGDGGQTVTNPMTESAGDPALTCAWNKPDDFTGYRTVWYRFTAESDGYVTIVTSGSSYDTILSVYQGSCGLKIPVACNDDYNGFASQVKIPVNAGLTYYVEVADWHFGVSGQATLDLGAWITTYNRWDEVANMDVPRSRHASAISGDLIYIIGGQTIVSSIPSRTPAVSTYNTNTSAWTSLSTLPGPDGFGYSNTTAALVNGKIYLPSGYVGVDSLYDSTHWVYDIATNQWSTSVPNNWADSEPAIYSTAQPYSSTSIPAGYFLVGGLTGSIPLPVQQPPPDWQARDEMYYYVPSLNFWFQRTPMNTGRFGHTSALQNIGGTDHLCVVGGIGSGIGNIPVVLSQGECYNIVTEQWSIVTGPLNYPRYYAASGIDQDGNWIVYGGINHLGQNVAPTEVYNRETNQWEILNAFSSLGAVDEETSPPRAWPRAGFVDSSLYAIGGERTNPSGGNVINLVESLLLPNINTMLPIVSHQDPSREPDDTFENARLLPYNYPANGIFISLDDYVDVWYFDVNAPRNVTVKLNNIPLGSNYDLVVYNSDKVWQGASTNPGSSDETVPLFLNTGTYYAVVQRIFPTPGSPPAPQHYVIEAVS